MVFLCLGRLRPLVGWLVSCFVAIGWMLDSQRSVPSCLCLCRVLSLSCLVKSCLAFIWSGLSGLVPSCPALSCPVFFVLSCFCFVFHLFCCLVFCLVLYCLTLSCLALSCVVLFCFVLSHLFWPGLVGSGLVCLVWSCLVWSCLVLSCFVWPCFCICWILSCLVSIFPPCLVSLSSVESLSVLKDRRDTTSQLFLWGILTYP